MGMVNTTLRLETETLETAKSMGINVSETCREALRSKIGIVSSNVDDINLELLQIEITRLQNQISKDTVVLSSKLEQMEVVKAKIRKKEVEMLENEKKRIEDTKKCDICGFAKADAVKMHKFPVGQVCNTCFLEKRDAGKWFKAKEAV